MAQAVSESKLSCLQVDVTTVDEFCKERGITDVGLVKLDIESLEPQAIEGMQTIIEQAHPHLFVEILQGKGTDTALDRLARQFAYNVFALDPEGPHLHTHIVVDARRRNYLFTLMSPQELQRFINTASAPILPCSFIMPTNYYPPRKSQRVCGTDRKSRELS
jgi:hypothetical protein